MNSGYALFVEYTNVFRSPHFGHKGPVPAFRLRFTSFVLLFALPFDLTLTVTTSP